MRKSVFYSCLRHRSPLVDFEPYFLSSRKKAIILKKLPIKMDGLVYVVTRNQINSLIYTCPHTTMTILCLGFVFFNHCKSNCRICCWLMSEVHFTVKLKVASRNNWIIEESNNWSYSRAGRLWCAYPYISIT